MPSKSRFRRSTPSPSPADPLPSTLSDASASKAARKPRYPVPALPDASRFAAAVQAALIAAKNYRNPHAQLLDTLRTRFHTLASPFARGLEVLAEDLFGGGDEPWRRAHAAFYSRYAHHLAAANAEDQSASETQVEAAERRYWALLCLAEWQQPEEVKQWLQSCPVGLDRADRFCALITAAAAAPLRRFPQRTNERFRYEFDLPDLLTLAAGLVTPSSAGATREADTTVSGREAPATTAFDLGLVTAWAALSLPAQQALLFSVTLLDLEAGDEGLTHVVWDDEYAAWAELELAPVRSAFMGTEERSAPLSEAFDRRVELPDYQMPGRPSSVGYLYTHWYAHAPIPRRQGERQGLQISFTPSLLPYLRQLCECYYQAFEHV